MSGQEAAGDKQASQQITCQRHIPDRLLDLSTWLLMSACMNAIRCADLDRTSHEKNVTQSNCGAVA